MAFFEEAERILTRDGTITVVTDNLWYGKFLLRQLSAPGSSSLPLISVQLPQRQVLEEQGGIRLYVGQPGRDCGHVSDASSYFDRLWKRESLTERYFLFLRKGTPGESSETTKRVSGKSKTVGEKYVTSNQVNEKKINGKLRNFLKDPFRSKGKKIKT